MWKSFCNLDHNPFIMLFFFSAFHMNCVKPIMFSDLIRRLLHKSFLIDLFLFSDCILNKDSGVGVMFSAEVPLSYCSCVQCLFHIAAPGIACTCAHKRLMEMFSAL